MKKLLIGFIFIIAPVILCAQYGPYDRQSFSRYTPLSQGDIFGPAMQMRQRYDNNAAKVDQLINWIFQLKSQTNDQQFLNAMDSYYQTLSGFYNQDLARMDNQIRSAQFGIQQEIDKCNKRMQKDNYADQANRENKNRNFQGALQYINQAIAIDGNDAYLYLLRGNIYVELNDYWAALLDYTSSIEISPDYAAYYN